MPGSIRAAGLLALVLSVACHHRGKPPAAAVGPDSAQGVVSIVGTGFDQQLMLQGAAGARPTRLRTTTEADSAALTRLGGVEVLVRGTRADDGFRVSTFTAVRVGPSPVVDGVLRLDGDHVVLETGTGRTTLGNPPDALRRMIGARVWISGPLATGPNSYGIIVPAR